MHNAHPTPTPPTESPRRLLKPEEASAWLQISPRTLRSMKQRGEVPAVRVGKQTRYDPDDLRRYVEANKTSGH